MSTARETDPPEVTQRMKALPTRDSVEAGPRRAALITLVGPQIGRRFPLASEVIHIGRSSQCPIAFEDNGLSREHARIVPLPGMDYEIHDLDSRNGTFVNGQRVTERQLLQHADRIRFGPRVMLQFTVEDPLDQRLANAQKMEIVGLLGAGVSHDFNNLLTVIRVNTDYLRSLPPETGMYDGEVQDCLHELLWATDEAEGLTERLSTFVRNDEEQIRENDFSLICTELASTLKRVLPAEIRIEHRIQKHLVVEGNRSQLHQILMNPCINARDAMPDGGLLRIEARLAHVEEVAGYAQLEDAPHVRVAIIDSGVGMDVEVLQNVFTPLFTTKHRGTGLGMATVARLTREHGGHVDVESEPGKGTRILIFLPSATVRGRRPPSTTTVPLPMSTNDALSMDVLVVDDEAMVCKVAARILKGNGHTVRIAHDGLEALEHFKGASLPDAVLLDVNMPRMDGPTCFESIRELYPEMPVVFVSGGADTALRKRMIDAGASAFLLKPFQAADLIDALRDACSGCAVVLKD